jgi:hypothetical protein
MHVALRPLDTPPSSRQNSLYICTHHTPLHEHHTQAILSSKSVQLDRSRLTW